MPIEELINRGVRDGIAKGRKGDGRKGVWNM
jgi:hypothetical protein